MVKRLPGYFILFFILAGVAVMLQRYEEKETSLPQEKRKKITFTPEELKAAEMQRKQERRKNGYRKFDGPDQYVQFQYDIRVKEGERRPGYALNYKLHELKKAQQNPRLHQKRTAAMNWVERGPANVPGRTRALLADENDPQFKTWFAGSVGGGVWKTTDGGGSWQLLTPDLPNLAISSLARCESAPNVIYAGTGEGFFNVDAINGDGIFKTVDGGGAWTQLASTAGDLNFQNINRIIVDPENPDIVLACSNHGRYTSPASVIMRSADGGASWTEVYSSGSRIQQLIHAPDDFDVQYATVNGIGVIKSTNGGVSWQDASEGLAPAGRLEIAISPQDPQYLYASVEGKLTGSGSDLYVTSNGGALWRLVVEENDGTNHDWLGNQGWYNNAIAVHPFDKNVVYVGGINLWKMEIVDPSGATVYQPVHAEAIDTESFMEFVDFGGLFLGGGLTTGEDWFSDYNGYPTSLQPTDYVSVEIRFGSGQSQRAHRFIVPTGAADGVTPPNYSYQNYVNVPFEVWDVTNNRQLMVSFRDQDRNGAFNLRSLDPNNPAQGREYIFIHAVNYNPSSPNTNIMFNGGMAYKNIYALWPALPEGATWSPSGLPASKIAITAVERAFRRTVNMTDGYGNITGKNTNVHVDHHAIVPVVVNHTSQTFKLLSGNDGGVHVSLDDQDPGVADETWLMAGMGYNTSQFYGADKKRGEDEYIGGLQDNGTWRSEPGSGADATAAYKFQLGGDGFDAVWNYADPKKIIGSSQYNTFFRSVDGGESWSLATAGLGDAYKKNAPFISKIENVKTNPDVLFTVGRTGVWRSDDFGAQWSVTPITEYWLANEDPNAFAAFTDVKISLSNNSVVWAGAAMSSTARLHVSTDGGLSFTPVNNYAGEIMGAITGLATHPDQDSTAYALFSFADSPKILRTTDLGETWTDISGFAGVDESVNGFPDVAVYSLFVFPNEPNRIWAGTEIGVVESTDNGQTWTLANNGLPNTAVWDMKLVDNQIVVATHGRGIWTVEIPIDVTTFFAPFINAASMTPQGLLAVDASMRSNYDSVQILIDNSVSETYQNVIVSEALFKLPNVALSDTIDIAIDAYHEDKVVRSNYVKAFIFEVDEYLNSYQTDFNDQSVEQDFAGSGFSVRMVANFNDMALHSPHDYLLNRQYIYILKKPIIIAEEHAVFSYEDIAIIEPGEDDAEFGDPDFYDYVVIEGATDGLNWIPLPSGYDARRNGGWLTAYQNDVAGTPQLFVKQNFNLLNYFDAGDTVLFRFRLYSDPGESGWGWAIDNLSIQSGEPLYAGGDPGADYFIKSYPNPVRGKAQLHYALPRSAPASVQIFNISGSLVQEFTIGAGQPREGRIEWEPSAKGLYIARISSRYGDRSVKILAQ